MTHRAIFWLLPFALACTPPSKSIGDGESGSAEGSGGGSEDAVASEGSQSASMTSVGPSSDGTTGTSGDSQDSIQSGTATANTLGTDTDDPTTTEDEPSMCEIFMVVAAAAIGKMEPDDCGFVRLDDPLVAWEAAQTCVLDHYSGGLAFTLVAEQQGIDSEVRIGFAGAQGEVYVASRFLSDSNGLIPGTLITGGPCNISPIIDCVVQPGELCLDCPDSPDPVTICEEP